MTKKKTSKGKRGKSMRGAAARPVTRTETGVTGVQGTWAIDDVPLPSRLERETVKAYRAFSCYSRQNPSSRSIKATSKLLGYTTVTHSGKWSSENNWQTRVKKYDRAVERSKARAWHQHRAAQELTQLERQRKVQEGAGDLLLEASVDAIRAILTERGEEHDGKPGPLLSRPAERIAAIQTLLKMAAHKPEPPLPPAPESEEGGHDYGAAFATLRSLGVTDATIRRMIADARARKALEEE